MGSNLLHVREKGVATAKRVSSGEITGDNIGNQTKIERVPSLPEPMRSLAPRGQKRPRIVVQHQPTKTPMDKALEASHSLWSDDQE